MSATLRSPNGTASGTTGATTTVTVTLPTGTQVGDVLLVCILSAGGVSHGTPTGWTQLRDDSPAGTITQGLWYRVADGTEGATAAFGQNSSVAAIWAALAYQGDNTSAPVDVTSGDEQNSNSITAPSVTTSGGGECLVGFYGENGALAITKPSQETQRLQFGDGSRTMCVADEQLSSSGPTGSRSASISAPKLWIGQLVAINPAAVSGNPSDQSGVIAFREEMYLMTEE